jgi:hypothetical protein
MDVQSPSLSATTKRYAEQVVEDFIAPCLSNLLKS